MRKILKVVGLILGVLLVAAGGAALWINRGLPSYAPKRIDLHVEGTPERVARGKRLAAMLCTSCHTDPETGKLTGKRMEDVPPEFGEIHSSNITRDPEHGIGGWTDGELAYFIRTGVRRDGVYVPMYMVKLPRISDEELSSILAFLRSDDAWVAPSGVASVPSRPSFLVKLLSRVAWKPAAWPDHPIERPDGRDPVALGRYLAHDVLDCYACHSADFKTLDLEHPERSPGYMGGGNALLDINGKVIYAPNITPDEATGIGAWTEAGFARAMKGSFRPDGTPIRLPMPRLPELTDDEAKALYAFLRTVPKLHNERRQGASYDLGGPEVTGGQRVYYKYACQGCHGTDGKGVADLRGADRKYRTDEELIAWIRSPSRLRPGTKMPDWDGVISEPEYGPLAAYVRQLGQRSGP
jgi:mono/diheme cytochrome c family protein